MHGPKADEAKAYIANQVLLNTQITAAIAILAVTVPQVSLRSLERVNTVPRLGQQLKKNRHSPIWSPNLRIWVCSKCGKGARGDKSALLSKGCNGEDRLLAEVHPSHKLYLGALHGGGGLFFHDLRHVL